MSWEVILMTFGVSFGQSKMEKDGDVPFLHKIQLFFFFLLHIDKMTS